jgi:hypothetical protein
MKFVIGYFVGIVVVGCTYKTLKNMNSKNFFIKIMALFLEVMVVAIICALTNLFIKD